MADNDERCLTYRESLVLKELLLSRVESLEKNAKQEREALRERLAGMNEIRESMRDQASRFVSRSEHSVVTNQMCNEIDKHGEELAELRGKADQKSVDLAYVGVAVSIILSILGLVMKS